MSEKIIGYMDVEDIGRVNFIKHDDQDNANMFSWRASNIAGKVVNRSERFKNPEDPINDLSAIIAANGNPFKSQ